MAMRLTIQQFLQTAKQSFFSAVDTAQPVTVVAGNTSADLDSFASSILFAYLETSTPSTLSDHPHKDIPRPLIPLLNIPRKEVSLRPEILYLANHLAFHSSDLFCLDDIPSSLAPAQTHFVLVDHNVLQGELGGRFSSRISAIIDHHVDEGTEPTCKPRIITTSGSCCSLVSEYFREKWDDLHLPADINAQLAKLALAPILDDTSNLQHRVTPVDVAAVTHLVSKCQQGTYTEATTSSSSSSSATTTITKPYSAFSQEDFYKSIQHAKLALDHMSLSDLLRKDYKEWTDSSNNIKLGISSVPKSLYWLIQRESDSHKEKKEEEEEEEEEEEKHDDDNLSSFYSTLKSWSTERSLDVVVIMTRDAGQEDLDFTRGLFVWGVSNKAKEIKRRLLDLDKKNEELGLEKWEGGDEFDIESEDRQAWKQQKIEKSRKQVAPYLREVISKL